MAFTKTPTVSTYRTQPLPLLREYNSRASGFSKDVDYLNVFFEPAMNKLTQEKSYDIFCRPGIDAFSTILQSINVRAVYYWEEESKYYVWIDDDIQIVNGTTGAIITTITGVLGTSSGKVAVTEFLYDTGDVKLVFTDGVDIKTIDSANTIAASVSPDLPTPLEVSLVFLDGYLFVIKGGTSDIYNSNLNDPLAWTAGDFLSSEILPDRITALSKINNYLVAFGPSSIEYFWDAANPSGSPMQRNDTPVKFNGYLGGLASHGNKLFYIGNSTEGSPSLFMLEDFNIKELGNPSLRRQFEAAVGSFDDYQGTIVSVSGHTFYVVTAAEKTYAIDVETGLWSRWASATATSVNILYSANSKTSTRYQPVFYVTGQPYLHRFDETITTDGDVPYDWMIITDVEDFDSYKQKVINRLTLVGDRPVEDTVISISWTDDDYQTYSTPQTVNLKQELPCIYQCGSFRRRAHKLTASPTVPFRIRHIEVDVNLGNS